MGVYAELRGAAPPGGRGCAYLCGPRTLAFH